MGLRQVGKNIARMSVLLVLVSIAAFFLVTVSPLDPLRTNVGQAALGSMSQEQIAQLEEYWGVNTPPVKRYVSWAADFLRGDMGTSLLYRQPVSKVIGEKLANSLWLMASAWLVSGAVGFVLGVAAGARKGGLTDKLISAYALLTASIPAFGASYRAQCSHWNGGIRCHAGGQAGPRHPTGGSLVHYRHFQYRTSYKREDGRGHGERLCAVCKGKRGIGVGNREAAWHT